MTGLTRTSDYSSVAQWYDATRELPDDLLTELFQRFVRATSFERPAVILDAGCGNAQLSLPLMRMGYQVVGVDVSDAMLSLARAKVAPDWNSPVAPRRSSTSAPS